MLNLTTHRNEATAQIMVQRLLDQGALCRQKPAESGLWVLVQFKGERE